MHQRHQQPRPLFALLLVVLCACTGARGEGEAPREAGEVDGTRASGPIEDGASRSDGEDPAVPRDASQAGADVSTILDASTKLDAWAGTDGSSSSPLGPGACPGLTSGWSRYYPTSTIQFQGAGTNNEYCTYWNDGGIEYFQLDKNPALLIQRCEARVNNDYLSGQNEFEGDVLVTEADNMCIHQVFNFLMIVAYPEDGGEFREHSGTFLQSGTFGHWVHVNTIHDTATDTVHIYLDCQHVYDGTDSPAPSDAGWYNKYGLYGIQGLPPQEPTSIVRWTGMAYYRHP
jgi:hypothetical protein